MTDTVSGCVSESGGRIWLSILSLVLTLYVDTASWRKGDPFVSVLTQLHPNTVAARSLCLNVLARVENVCSTRPLRGATSLR